MLARAVTHALVGLEPQRVEVEAHIQNGVPSLAIVGLADRACSEARERVRSGIASAELDWPMRRVTVNLAPAELRKEGSGFDLPIALAVVSATQTAGLPCRFRSTMRSCRAGLPGGSCRDRQGSIPNPSLGGSS